jgi:transcription elongation factor
MFENSPQNVGVIVRVERDSFRILDTHGRIRVVKLTEMGHKRNSKNQIAFDCNRNPIAVGDICKVIDGEHKVIHQNITQSRSQSILLSLSLSLYHYITIYHYRYLNPYCE